MILREKQDKAVQKIVQTVECDYCGVRVKKPDQRENMIVHWGRIRIKKINPPKTSLGDPIPYYINFDICPDCMKSKKLWTG